MHLSTPVQSVIQQKLFNHFPQAYTLQFLAVGGGSINQAYKISLGKHVVFCKLNAAAKFPKLFLKETKGLELIAKQQVIKVPAVIDCFEQEDQQILLLEWIDEGERNETFFKQFGQQLATLHLQSKEYFGLDENNYMGSVPQSNLPHLTWTEFLLKERLEPMVLRCKEKQLLNKGHFNQFESLYKKLNNIFEVEKPSLLHGDLWSGNFMCSRNNQPVLIDPAVYYGHRSMDLAMTTLFGGFRQPFYEAYQYQFPFPPNYLEQWEVCNLYPLLIHLYLFGSSYFAQIESTLRRFS